jgi:hypothetical protein
MLMYDGTIESKWSLNFCSLDGRGNRDSTTGTTELMILIYLRNVTHGHGAGSAAWRSQPHSKPPNRFALK